MIVLINLVNETDVIGRLIKNGHDQVHLTDVMKIYMMPSLNASAPPVIYCRKFSPYVVGYDVTLRNIHILNQTPEYDIDQLVLDYYMTTVKSYKDNQDGRLKLSTEYSYNEEEHEELEDSLFDKFKDTLKKDIH
jgi:hypothetical protein